MEVNVLTIQFLDCYPNTPIPHDPALWTRFGVLEKGGGRGRCRGLRGGIGVLP